MFKPVPTRSLPLNNPSPDDEEATKLRKEGDDFPFTPVPKRRNHKVISLTRTYVVAVHLFVAYLVFRLWNVSNTDDKTALLEGQSWCKCPLSLAAWLAHDLTSEQRQYMASLNLNSIRTTLQTIASIPSTLGLPRRLKMQPGVIY
jgi:hypothetical protein